MEFLLRITTNDDGMQTYDDVRAALKSVCRYLKEYRQGELLEEYDNAPIRDKNEIPVGKWKVISNTSEPDARLCANDPHNPVLLPETFPATGAFSCPYCGRSYCLPEDADILEAIGTTGKCFEDCPGRPQ